jgi:hypothetical protein
VNQVVPRNTVEYIVECRDKALELYELAFGKIAEADAAIKQAADMWRRASPNMSGYYVGDNEEIKSFHSAVTLPDRELYLRTARKLIDCTVWDHIITMSGLESLMDKQAKDELRAQMKYVPERPRRNGEVIDEEEAGRTLPPLTVGNVYATLEGFMSQSEMIFRRGIANAFSKLDRRFRSHNGFRIGDRIVLSYAFDENGRWSYHRSHRDTIADIERAFRVIDGQDPTHNTMGIVWVVEKERGGGWDKRQSEHEGEFFRIRIFKNGNAHLWFTRKDLLEKVNRILAEWYGEVVGDANTTDDDPFAQVKTAPAKYYGFYPTPEAAAERLVNGDNRYNRGVSWLQEAGKPPLRVLEPSAGTGNLARLCAAKDMPEPSDYMKRGNYQQRVTVDCVEIQPHLAAGLEAQGLYRKVTCADFMALQPDPANLYDVVMMNPPFDRERDIDHVCHALKFLKPGGTLHAIMSAGTEFRSTRKAEAFRALMERLGASWDDLPPNSFSEVGTNVNTLILRVRKTG